MRGFNYIQKRADHTLSQVKSRFMQSYHTSSNSCSGTLNISKWGRWNKRQNLGCQMMISALNCGDLCKIVFKKSLRKHEMILIKINTTTRILGSSPSYGWTSVLQLSCMVILFSIASIWQGVWKLIRFWKLWVYHNHYSQLWILTNLAGFPCCYATLGSIRDLPDTWV